MTPQPQMQVVAPSPVPQSYVLANPRMGDGATIVSLTFYSPTGQHVVFLDPDSAQKLSEELSRYAAQARAGLIIAGAMREERPHG